MYPTDEIYPLFFDFSESECVNEQFEDLGYEGANFVELTMAQADVMDPPPKIYDNAKSGLKQNIVTSFKTPFGAFQKAGFTEELVGKWTVNYNM